MSEPTLSHELSKHRLGQVDLYIRWGPEDRPDLYTTSGTTTDPREAAEADAILFPDDSRDRLVFREVAENDRGSLWTYHPRAGKDTPLGDTLDAPVTMLRRLPAENVGRPASLQAD